MGALSFFETGLEVTFGLRLTVYLSQPADL